MRASHLEICIKALKLDRCKEISFLVLGIHKTHAECKPRSFKRVWGKVLYLIKLVKYIVLFLTNI